MLNRRSWLALTGGPGLCSLAGLRAQSTRQPQSARQPQASRQQGQTTTTVRVEMPSFEGVYLRDIEPDNLQTAEYLAGVKPYPQAASVQQVGWFQIGQRLMLTKETVNFAWRLFGLYHGTRSGLPAGDVLDAALSFDFLPESRVLPLASRLPVRLDPMFRFDRPLKDQVFATMRVEDAAGKPLGESLKISLERLEEREVSLAVEAKEGAEVYACYTLSDGNGTVAAEARRPVLLSSNVRPRTAKLSAEGTKLLLATRPGESARAIGARTIREVSAHYEAAMASYLASYPERMHPFLARATSGVIPRCWTSSARGETELGALESLAARLSKGEPVRPSDLAVPRLVWRPGESENEHVFRVLLPEKLDPAKRWPLLVALHPELGDEGSLDEMFLGPDGKSILGAEAARRGYVVLLPGARGPFGWQANPNPARLLELVRQFPSVWPTDPKQVFLWSHSGGATMAFRLLLEAGIWSGAALVAGRPPANYDFAKVADVPIALIAGGADAFVPPREMLVVSYKLQRAVKQRETITLEGQDHWSAGAAAIAPAFEFFDKVRRAMPGPASSRAGQ